MRFFTSSIAVVFATVALNLEMFTTSANASNFNFQQQAQTNGSSSTLSINQENPALLARNTKRRTKKSKLRQPRPKKSSAQISEYENIYYRGRQAAYECIVEQERDSATKECRELVETKSSLTNWCYQDSVACTYVDRLASDEIYYGTYVKLKPA